MTMSCRARPSVVLAALAAISVASACSTTPSVSTRPSAVPPSTPPAAHGEVSIGHAGMLTALVGGLVAPMAAQGVTVRATKGNSLTVAGNIENGSLPADLFGSADANANQVLMGTAGGDKVSWYAVIARNAVVLAYSPRSSHLAEFQAAQRGAIPWYQPLQQSGVRLGRDNPDTDPLGYYDIFVAQLAERSAGQPGLARQILGDDRNPAQVVNTSPDLLASGQRDAQFMYLTGAAAAHVPYISLPAWANLSDPAHAHDYAAASFTTTSGTTFHGSVIYASIAPIAGSPNPAGALRLLTYLFGPEGQRLLRANGFLPSPLLVGGDRNVVPAPLRPFVQGSYPPG